MISSLFTLVLVGCGGGGGGSSDSAAPPPVTPRTIAQDATYAFDGIAVTGVSDKNVSTTPNAAVSLSRRGDGTIDQISITTPTTSVTWNEANGDIIDESDVVVTMTNTTDSDIGIIVNGSDPNLNWQYQTFGVWETGRGDISNTVSGTFGAATVGTPTAGSAIPTTGSATFTGLVGGVYVDAPGTNDYITAGKMTADVNFLNRQVTLTTSDTQKVNTITAVESPAPNLNMAGILNYAAGTNTFTGTVSATGLTGESTGQFNGPNAEELGGVFSLIGAGVETYIGGYGGVKQ